MYSCIQTYTLVTNTVNKIKANCKIHVLLRIKMGDCMCTLIC